MYGSVEIDTEDRTVENLSLNGYFWLPDHPDNKIAGLFTFSTDSGGMLQLIGSFTSLFDLANSTVRDTKRIIGSNIGGTKHYTLDNCRQTALGNSQTFYVGTVVETYAFDRGEPIECDEVTLSLTNLQAWINLSGIEYEMTLQEARDVGHMQIGVKSIPTMTTSFPRGKLSIKHRMSMSHKLAEGALSERFEARLSFDNVLPYADAMDSASDLQDLLTIATHRVAGFEKVELMHPIFAAEHGKGESEKKSARLWSEWLAQSKPSRHTLTDSDMTFTFAQLGGIDGIGRWMTAAEMYRPQLGRVMNTRYNQHMFQQDIHLGRTAALESFHALWPKGTKPKKKSEHIPLRVRLEELADFAGPPFDALVPKKKRPVWCQKIVDERNDVAHHLGRNLHQDIVELHYLSESTYWLFAVCILRVADAPTVCFDQLVKHRNFQRCTRELDGLL